MDTHRFGALSRMLAGRRSHRPSASRLQQQATPVDTQEPEVDPALLFVQIFQSGQLAPHPTDVGAYSLTLSGGANSTLYFSDRPDRIVGTMPTSKFMDVLGMTAGDPANAALLAQSDGAESVYIVELLDHSEDGAGTATYKVRILGEGIGAGVDLAFSAAGSAPSPETVRFGASHLFVDDIFCGNHSAACVSYCFKGKCGTSSYQVGLLPGAYTYHWSVSKNECRPNGGCQPLIDLCNATFPLCEGSCSVYPPDDGFEFCEGSYASSL